MYNLLIAIGLSLGALLVGYGLAGSLIAGILPAVVTFIAAYMYLARKSLAQLEAIMGRANDEMKVFQTMAPPTSLAEYNRLLALRTEKLQKTRDIMAAGFPLAKWQYLVAEQLHAQLGALDYMEQKYTNARPHLEKAWSRNWQSHAMLSCIDFREGNKDGAVARMEKLEGVASKEGVYWGLAVWLALEAGKRDKALQLLAKGVVAAPGSEPLKQMDVAVRNGKAPDVHAFAPTWYHFFPEQVPQQQVQANQQPTAEQVEMMKRYEAEKRKFKPPTPRR
jgi:hypothetical protein